MRGAVHMAPYTWQLPWLAVEWPWLALAEPFLTLLAEMSIETTPLPLIVGRVLARNLLPNGA